MKLSRLSFGLAAALVLAACAPAPQTSDAPEGVRHVFIISLDQGAPRNILKSEMPALKDLVRNGAHTWEAYTIVPSLTLPAHVSMLTGVGIQKHQILWNEFEPEKGRLTTPTVFSLAKQRGLTTALYAAKTKFLTFRAESPFDAFVFPPDPKSPGFDAETVARAFAADVGKLKPNVCFIHFSDADGAGHKFGVDSPEKLAALAACDRALKIVVDAISAAGLADSSVILISADHGGHDRTEKENAERAEQGKDFQPGTHGSPHTDDVVIPWIAWGRGVKKDFTITQPVVVYDTAATALWLLHIPEPPHLWGRPVKTAFETR